MMAALLPCACGTTPVGECKAPSTPRVKVTSKPEPPRLPVCLVLSVGAQDGLAHIGVIRAVQERGIPIDCVVGTSMGALVGGLYAADPSGDPGSAYRLIAQRYEKKAREEGGSSMVWGALLTGALVAASGGAAAPVLLGATAGGGLGASSVQLVEWKRLQASLVEQYDGVTIESLPMRFGTVYQKPTESGMSAIEVAGGMLAKELSYSIANPLIFNDVHVSAGAQLDPGADQVSAVPVQAACNLFPGRQLVVSNVTSGEVFTSRNMTCPFQVVAVKVPTTDIQSALRADEPAFGQLLEAGYSAAIAQVDWSRLPDRTHPPTDTPASPPLQTVQVTLSVEVSERKPNGALWDFGAPMPEIRHRTFISSEGHDGFGSSASVSMTGQVNDQLSATWNLGTLRLRPGMTLNIILDDVDVFEDDHIGDFSIEYQGAKPLVFVEQDGVKVTVRFDHPIPGAAR